MQNSDLTTRLIIKGLIGLSLFLSPLQSSFAKRKERGLRVDLGTNLTRFHLKQENLSDQASSYYLTAKLNLRYTLNNGTTSYSLGAFQSYLDLSHSPKSSGAPNIFGVNLRLNQNLTSPIPRTSFLAISFGWYWIQTIQGDFGFETITGPQIYLSGNIKIKQRFPLSLYIKFAPFFDENSLESFNLSNREIAIGLLYKIHEARRKPTYLGITLDASQLYYRKSTGLWVQSQSQSLGVQIGF